MSPISSAPLFIFLFTCKVPELEFVVRAATDHPGAAGVEGEAGDGLVAVRQTHLIIIVIIG